MSLYSVIRATNHHHAGRAFLGAACLAVALVLFNQNVAHFSASLLTTAGALLLFLTNPNSVTLVNKTFRSRRLPKTAPLARNIISQISYDVRHAPRPGRHL